MITERLQRFKAAATIAGSCRFHHTGIHQLHSTATYRNNKASHHEVFSNQTGYAEIDCGDIFHIHRVLTRRLHAVTLAVESSGDSRMNHNPSATYNVPPINHNSMQNLQSRMSQFTLISQDKPGSRRAPGMILQLNAGGLAFTTVINRANVETHHGIETDKSQRR